ncbi:MAG: OmpA family protein [Parabacteroides gordonii]|nr:OmpA family protein [Parabacteroides gordonii]
MRKRILEGIAGIGLLAVLPACNVSKQATTEKLYSVAREMEAEVEQPMVAQTFNKITRSVEVPLLKVDAQSIYARMITYIIPNEELAPKISAERISAYIDFPAGSVSVNPKYGNNCAELAKLEERLMQLLQGDNGDVKNIRITGYASPDGNTKENERLAGNRAIQFKNYLQKKSICRTTV